MPRTLVIGYGNIYRRDDGVGFAVVNALHERLYGRALDPDRDPLEKIGEGAIDLLVLHQLVPDLAETLAEYDLVVFVDAHVESLPEPLLEQEIASRYKPGLVTHQLHPSSLLALAHDLYARTPRGVILSVRGTDMDFGPGLSEAAAAQVPGVVARILTLAAGDSSGDAHGAPGGGLDKPD
ncbi:MAG: hydrogenase maturation protease [Anaerolineae bacterium]